MVKKVGNLIPNTFFITKGSGESDLEKHAGSYHMALYDAGISDFNIMTYSSVIPATAHLATMDELDLPPFGSEMKTIMAVSHGYQDEFVSAGVVYAWMYKDENFDEKVGGLVCEVSGRYRIEELESRLIRVINELHPRGNHDRETLWNGVGRPLLRGFPSTGDRGISRVEYFCDIYRAGSFQEPAFLLTLSNKKHINIVFVI